MSLRLPLLSVLLLLAALLMAAGAHGASTPPAPNFLAFEEPLEAEEETEEEGEEEESECETAEEEVEEGELPQADADEICKEEEATEARKKRTGHGGGAPEECVLRSAHANAALISHDSKLKLTLGYTTYEPTSATISVGHLTTLHRHLGRSGVLRIVENLGKKHPKRLTVRLDIAAVPGYCGKYRAQKIKVH